VLAAWFALFLSVDADSLGLIFVLSVSSKPLHLIVVHCSGKMLVGAAENKSVPTSIHSFRQAFLSYSLQLANAIYFWHCVCHDGLVFLSVGTCR